MWKIFIVENTILQSNPVSAIHKRDYGIDEDLGEGESMTKFVT
jgi:hypothetical protein